MELLIEIGVEELPAIPFLKERANIAPKWRAVLETNRINSDFRFEFSPRRFVLFHGRAKIRRAQRRRVEPCSAKFC